MSLCFTRLSKSLMTGFLLFLNYLFLHSVRRQDNGIYSSFRDYYLLSPEALEKTIYAHRNYQKVFPRTDRAQIQSFCGK